MPNITVRKNWKKKIQAICSGVKEMNIFSLENGFIPEVASIPEDDQTLPEQYLENFVNNKLYNQKSANLIYNKETGVATLHIHSNLWYSWTNKIEW